MQEFTHLFNVKHETGNFFSWCVKSKIVGTPSHIQCIYNGYLPWLFAVWICRNHLPWEFAAAVRRGFLPWAFKDLLLLFTIGICRKNLPWDCFVYVCKPFFWVSKSFFFLIILKSFSFSNSFLFLFSFKIFFLFICEGNLFYSCEFLY